MDEWIVNALVILSIAVAFFSLGFGLSNRMTDRMVQEHAKMSRDAIEDLTKAQDLASQYKTVAASLTAGSKARGCGR